MTMYTKKIPLSIQLRSGAKLGRDQKIPAFFAIDCEMVTCTTDSEPKRFVNLTGEVTIIDSYGKIVLHTYAKPHLPIVSYNTLYSGITPKHLNDAPPLHVVSEWVKQITENNYLVGFAVHNDLLALRMHHPRVLTIDVQKHPYIRHVLATSSPSLKRTVKCLLNHDIQNGAHSSLEDAKATMDVFKWLMKVFPSNNYHMCPLQCVRDHPSTLWTPPQ